MNLELPPFPTEGVNLHVMKCARLCQLNGINEVEAEHKIMSFQGSTRRPLKVNEVKRAIEKAYGTPYQPRTAEQKAAPKLKWEPSKTRQSGYRRNRYEMYDLWQESPDILDGGISQRMILDWLFPDPDGLVCVGKSAFEFHTARIDQFKDLSKCQFIVPCYMSKKRGLTQDGKPSMHCLDNCGPRRFCVCDFDEPSSDQHPGIIMELKRLFDLVMVLSSGGKSLHAWFWVDPDEEEDFWNVAVPRGADPAIMRNRSSFVRMPMGLRDNGNRQGVVYFDHRKIKE